MEKEEKMWCVYCHTNLINGKKYIGQTSQKPEQRWASGRGYKGSPHFWNAIQKYGWDNFSHEILYDNLTLDEANQLEVQLIAEYNTLDENYGYNVETGGKNGSHPITQETKEKISNTLKGHIPWNKGVPMSDEQKEKMKNIVRPKGIPCTEECKKKISETETGKYVPIEVREKIAEKIRGNIPWNKGKHLEVDFTPKKVKCVETNVVYNSVAEAARDYNIPHSGISACICGKQKTANGLHWELIEDI